MESILQKGDKVRRKKRGAFSFLFKPEVMIVMDVHEFQYKGENVKTVGVSVQDRDGKPLHFSQDSLEKIS